MAALASVPKSLPVILGSYPVAPPAPKMKGKMQNTPIFPQKVMIQCGDHFIDPEVVSSLRRVRAQERQEVLYVLRLDDGKQDQKAWFLTEAEAAPLIAYIKEHYTCKRQK